MGGLVLSKYWVALMMYFLLHLLIGASMQENSQCHCHGWLFIEILLIVTVFSASVTTRGLIISITCIMIAILSVDVMPFLLP